MGDVVNFSSPKEYSSLEDVYGQWLSAICDALVQSGKASKSDVAYIIGGLTAAGLALRVNGNESLGQNLDAGAKRLASDNSRLEEELSKALVLLGYQ
ncbi:MAG TPA: hypothetical protein DEH24_20355 [Alteromonas sp.]|nr:hypothetical protein [Alteromonas sp.]|tara:strand:+ start:638 stop:928 length:291 start_codon:yes stop_codon:yes gene_type:complete